MALPGYVEIGPATYTISYGETPSGSMGWCNYPESQIIVRDDLSDSQTRLTVWHECLHALLQVHAPHRADFLVQRSSGDMDELYVASFEVTIPMLVRDNPDLWDWITGLIDELEDE